MTGRLRLHLCGLAVLVAVTAAACGSTTTDGVSPASARDVPEPVAPATTAASDSAEGTPPAGSGESWSSQVAHQAVPCIELVEKGWTPGPGEPMLAYDAATGLAQFRFGEDRPVIINLYDPECMRIPDLALLIPRTVRNYEETRRSECEASVEKVRRGEVPVLNGPGGKQIIGSLEALRELVLEWCPPEYAGQLTGAGD